jgi:hypothetical protein
MKENQINIANKNAVLVGTKIRFAELNIKDKTVTGQVASTYQSESSSVGVSKRLFDNATLKPLRAIRSKVAKYVKEKTLPWDDNGGRLLPAKNLTEYQVFIGECREAMNQGVEAVIENYKAIIDDARERLGQMFNESEFPTVEQLREKYSIETNFEPMPKVDDFRLDGLNGQNENLKAEMAKSLTKKINNAHSEIFNRLLEVMKHLSEKLNDDDGVFRDSSVKAIWTEISNARDMNFTNDKTLTGLCDRLDELLIKSSVNFNPNQLREDDANRSRGVEVLNQAVDTILANCPN